MTDTPRELIAASLEIIDEVAGQLDGDAAEQLGAARDKLRDLRDAVVTLREENAELRERVRTLEASFGKREELVRHKGVYWVRGDPDPWCPVCWEKDQRSLHLARTDILAGRLCQCPHCGYNANLDNVYPPREWQDD